MIPRVRLIAAGLLALATIGGYWCYAAWPAWRGTEIYLPVLTTPLDTGVVSLELPDERLAPDFPGVTRAPVEAVFVPVRAIGGLWDAKADEAANRLALRGRPLYVQFQPEGSAITGGWVAWRPVSISTGVIEGAVNLQARVLTVDAGGRLQVRYAARMAHLPPELAGAPITAAYVILKVLPSGRHAVTGLIIDGRRIGGQ
jgi:hypothetical protein